LILWDLYGEDDFQKVRLSYLRGAAGYLLVADGTRRGTVDTALGLQHSATGTLGDVPFVLLLNKYDLHHEWEIDQSRVTQLAAQGWPILTTSAKTGAGVEEAFTMLAQRILALPAPG
jgi:GTPase SAR1 family protein